MNEKRKGRLAMAGLKGTAATLTGGCAYVCWQAGNAFFGPLGWIPAIALGITTAGLGASAAKDVEKAVKANNKENE